MHLSACKLVSQLDVDTSVTQYGDGVGKQKRPQHSVWTIIFYNVLLRQLTVVSIR